MGVEVTDLVAVDLLHLDIGLKRLGLRVQLVLGLITVTHITAKGGVCSARMMAYCNFTKCT